MMLPSDLAQSSVRCKRNFNKMTESLRSVPESQRSDPSWWNRVGGTRFHQLGEPGEDLRDIADTLGQRQIFDDYQFFRVAKVRDWMAVGVGTDSKKLERASKLALVEHAI